MIPKLFQHAVDEIRLEFTDAELIRLHRAASTTLTDEQVARLDRAFALCIAALRLFSSGIFPRQTIKILDNLQKALENLADLFSWFQAGRLVRSMSPFPEELESLLKPHPDDTERDRQAKLKLQKLRYQPSNGKVGGFIERHQALGPLINHELAEYTNNEIDVADVSDILRVCLHGLANARECRKNSKENNVIPYFAGLLTDVLHVVCTDGSGPSAESLTSAMMPEVSRIVVERLERMEDRVASHALEQLDMENVARLAVEEYDKDRKEYEEHKKASSDAESSSAIFSFPGIGAPLGVGKGEQLISQSLIFADLKLTHDEINRLQTAAKVTFQTEHLGALTLPFITYIGAMLNLVHGVQPKQAGATLEKVAENVRKVIITLCSLWGSVAAATFASASFEVPGQDVAKHSSEAQRHRGLDGLSCSADGAGEVDRHWLLGSLVDYQLMRTTDGQADLPYALEILQATLRSLATARESIKNSGGPIHKHSFAAFLTDLVELIGTTFGRGRYDKETVAFVDEARKIAAERLRVLGEITASTMTLLPATSGLIPAIRDARFVAD